jgi:hypothetical protein
MKFFISAMAIATSAVFVAGAGNAIAAPDPVVVESSAPPVQYKSPFKDYRPLSDDKRIPWRAANDEVGKIGGWRVYLRESQEDNKAVPAVAPVTAVPPAPPTAPANLPAENKPKPMHDHAGHGQPK